MNGGSPSSPQPVVSEAPNSVFSSLFVPFKKRAPLLAPPLLLFRAAANVGPTNGGSPQPVVSDVANGILLSLSVPFGKSREKHNYVKESVKNLSFCEGCSAGSEARPDPGHPNRQNHSYVNFLAGKLGCRFRAKTLRM